ncbi:unnamed protein product [Cylindrotheca closterium]|uniref:Uncharacterized protein n=1 Tax=Cylindrotheca closterium TaxID=2856 RepID=A0AAD2FI34_9STRA|nr:unnamed protein product [Cylindrotheca closterium]
MCRPQTSSRVSSTQLFQRNSIMKNKQQEDSSSAGSSSLSFASPLPMAAPLSLPPLQPALRQCKVMEVNASILLPSISFDMMDGCEEEEEHLMLRPRFSRTAEFMSAME